MSLVELTSSCIGKTRESVIFDGSRAPAYTFAAREDNSASTLDALQTHSNEGQDGPRWHQGKFRPDPENARPRKCASHAQETQSAAGREEGMNQSQHL
jgi:hypothetical protein